MKSSVIVYLFELFFIFGSLLNGVTLSAMEHIQADCIKNVQFNIHCYNWCEEQIGPAEHCVSCGIKSKCYDKNLNEIGTNCKCQIWASS